MQQNLSNYALDLNKCLRYDVGRDILHSGCAVSPKVLSEQPYLAGAHADWLFAHNPGDTLQQRGSGQRAIICPVVETSREQGSGVEISKGSLFALKIRQVSRNRQSKLILNNEVEETTLSSTYFGLDGIKSIQHLLEVGIVGANLKKRTLKIEFVYVSSRKQCYQWW